MNNNNLTPNANPVGYEQSTSPDELFKTMLKSQEDYDRSINSFIMYLLDSQNDQNEQDKYIKKVFKTIAVQLQSQKKKPMRLFLAAQLVKNLMELGDDKFVDFTATDILPHYNAICQQEVHTPLNDNVLAYFGGTIAQNEQEFQIGQKFIKLILECVYVWARKNLKNTQFKQVYLELKKQHLQFHKSFQFFTKDEYLDEDLEDGKQGGYSNQKINSNNQIGSAQNLKNSQMNKSNSNVLNQSQKNSAKYTAFWQQLQQIIADSSRSSANSIQATLESMEPQLDACLNDIQGEINRLISVVSPGKEIEEALNQMFDYSQKFQTFKDVLKEAQQGKIQWTDISVMFQQEGNQKDNATPNPIQQSTNKNESQEGKQVSQLNKEAIILEEKKKQEEKKKIEEQQNIVDQNNAEQLRIQEKIRQEQETKRMEDLAKTEEERKEAEQLRLAEQIFEQRKADLERQNEQKRLAEMEIRKQQEQEEQLRKQEEIKRIEQLRIIEETKRAEEFRKAEEARKIVEEQARKDQEEARIQEMKLLSQVAQKKQDDYNENELNYQDVYNHNSAAIQGNQVHLNQMNYQSNNMMDIQEQHLIGAQQLEQQNQQYQQEQMLRYEENDENNNNNQEVLEDNYGAPQIEQQQIQELSFKPYSNETLQSKLYGSSVQGLKSNSVFTKTINQNIDKYYQPYASSLSKIGSQSQQELIISQRKRALFSEKDKLKEAYKEKESLSQQVSQLQNSVRVLQSDEKNQKLAVLQNMNEQCEGKITQQSLEISKLKKQLVEEQEKKERFESEELEQLRSYLSSLQSQLAEQRSTVKSDQNNNNNNPNTVHDIESLPQFQELQKQNEELKSRLSAHASHSISHNQQDTVNNVDRQLLQSKMKRAQSPKIFGNINQQPQRIIPAASLNQKQLQQQQISQQTPFSVVQQHQLPNTSNTIQKEQRSYNPILPVNSSRHSNIDNQNVMPSPQRLFANQTEEFQTPPGIGFIVDPSSGGEKQQMLGSGKRNTFEGEMRDISHPSIIYNDKREEIESIHQNNQSTHSYQESVKEILTPLQTKQNGISNENNNTNFQSFNAESYKNSNYQSAKSNILNFSNMKEGEQVEFNKSLFALVTQFVTKLNRFKASCLKTKYPIYEDPQIQIGVVTSHFLSPNGDYFRVQLYYTNKGAKLLKNLKLIALDDQQDLQMQISPELIPELESKGQKKQEVIITYKKLLSSPFFVSFNYSGAAPVYIGLPTVMTKTLVFKDTQRESFKADYKQRRYVKYILVPECNSKFAKTHQDFKIYIEKLIDLNPENEFDHIQETSIYKMGARFQFQHDHQDGIDNEKDLLLKVVCNPKHSALLYIAYDEENMTEKVNLVLNHLCFLFSSNKEE